VATAAALFFTTTMAKHIICSSKRGIAALSSTLEERTAPAQND